MKVKKPSLPRLFWTVKPVTKIKGSAKAYNRNKAKQALRKDR